MTGVLHDLAQTPAPVWTLVLFALAIGLGCIAGRAVAWASWHYARPPSEAWMANYLAHYKGEPGAEQRDSGTGAASGPPPAAPGSRAARGVAAATAVGGAVLVLRKHGVRRPGTRPRQ